MDIHDRVVCLSSPGPLEVWKHEWYHVVTNCQGHVLSPSGLPKVAKNHQKMPKIAFPYKYTGQALPDSRDRLAVGFVMSPWQVRIRQPAAIFISELTEIVRNGWVEEYF